MKQSGIIRSVRGWFVTVALGLALAWQTAPAEDQLELVFDIADVIAVPGETGVAVPVYMSNLQDTVEGFDIWFVLANSWLATLQPEVDTQGSLIGGWESLLEQQYTPDLIDLKVMADADNGLPPLVPGIGYPQYGETPLFVIMADILDIDDSVTERTVPLVLRTAPASNFSVYNEISMPLGLSLDSVLDTAYFRCEYWAPPPDEGICLSWARVSTPPFDSMSVGWDHYSWVDTVEKVQVSHGSIHVLRCGDVNGTDDKINLSDITQLVSYVYLDGDPPASLWAANVSGDVEQRLNLSDITVLVSRVYLDGLPMNCQ